MISSASLLLLAQLAAAPPPEVPVALSVRVQEAVAQAWQLPAEVVELAWGTVPALRGVEAEAPLRLGTVGRDGWLAVTLLPRGGAPRALRVRAGRRVVAPVAARPLPVGHLLADDDIRWDERVQWGARDADMPAIGPGWEVRRALRTGESLHGIAVAPPPAVASGGALLVQWSRGGVAIELDAVALTAGRIGDQVQARTATGRLTARLIAPGVARLEEGMP